MVAKDKAQGAPASHDEVDLDELLDVSRSTNIYLLISCICVLCTAHCIVSYCQLSNFMELLTRTQNLRSCTRRELLPWRYWSASFTYEAYASAISSLFLKTLYGTERGWEAWGAKKARARWIQGDNWRRLPRGGYWQWKGHMPFLPPRILPLQVCHNFSSIFSHIHFFLLLVLTEMIFFKYLLGSWINIWRPLLQSMLEQNLSSLMLKSAYYHC